jgi:hypothetical protein
MFAFLLLLVNPDLWFLAGRRLNRVGPGFASSDSDGLFDRTYENLAVANSTGPRRLLNGFDSPFYLIVLQDDLDLYLGKKIDDVFRATVEFRMALLAAEALGLDHGNTLKADFMKRLLYLIQFEGLDDRFDFFHELRAACF